MNVEHEKKNEVILKHIEIDIQNVKRVLNIKDGQTWKNFLQTQKIRIITFGKCLRTFKYG